MGTSGLTIVRERKAKRGNKTSALGGPSESQYFYKYYVCIYQRYDGYVEGCGLGTWLVNFLCKFKDNLKNDPSSYLNTGSLGAKLINEFMTSEYDAHIIPIMSLKNLFAIPPDHTYIITTTLDSEFDNSIMLSALHGDEIILTARPENFLGKYEYYDTLQKDKDKKSFTEIDYGDEVVNEGYFSEDQLFNKFLKDIPFAFTINGLTINIEKSW
ncbi:uncharacterized protein OCT59_016094 [Rhizophagus irregularis]|uniref:Uncharacterized protein n=3 Tax=Rhizophagus irregularis TaxID=588596 RepID=A0A015KV90_RHIIW|nr:hypothetical protein GLOIN_2v1530520 [Rhizophagus irregularis DAOM 181602=DAOM 197198]EXX63901.1 hypothetical protein RirG_147990 [Rhizophagus irregularis DAOM 197198w]POG79114.1 hypothetical protein GLOIN_2v1530520 [Rhizophagus irregularis DAOM 181602=DAOM 197198]UZO23763.1 hypothetical protein OCT59_016094 [Rhizophagus irregularis]GBC30999.1 hypothetical protein GLOIN_2v1530520 [Rhizophagus irregularis DAOM 181602=DAOM 197198]|eukprot:XP_025185980.1 hypothetical protein GLOIN_2v1530520 [Rhizophagus irregularis DAOM 181602=DAOM 197198]